jgi:AcrR family transcriptional regulator
MPRTAAQWDEIRRISRARIVRSAWEVFKTKGIHGASMNLIARRARVSKGLAYNYFPSKRDLLAAVVVQWLDESATLWEATLAVPDPLKGLRHLVDLFCTSVMQDPNRYRLFLVVFLESGYLGPIHAAGRRSVKLARQVGRIRSASRDLFKRLGSSEPEAEVTFFRLLTSGLAAEYIMSPEEFPMEAVKKRIVAYYRSLYTGHVR